MCIYDITAPIAPGKTPTYPGDPGIAIDHWATIAQGDPVNLSVLHLGAHTATHIDAPAHFIAGAPEVWTLPLEALIGEAHVVEIPEDVRAIEASHISTDGLAGATRVLFKTRNSAFWSETDGTFHTDFTYLTPDGARALVDRGVKVVGIDYLSVEQFGSKTFETHLILLSHNVIIIEGLDLREIGAGRYELICLPLRIAAGLGDGVPVRAVLRTSSGGGADTDDTAG